MKDQSNINTSIECKVRAKLTEYGTRINKLLPVPYEVDNTGYIETALWKLMKDFGRYIIRTSFHIAHQPFENNKIIIMNNGKLIKESKQTKLIMKDTSWRNML